MGSGQRAYRSGVGMLLLACLLRGVQAQNPMNGPEQNLAGIRVNSAGIPQSLLDSLNPMKNGGKSRPVPKRSLEAPPRAVPPPPTVAQYQKALGYTLWFYEAQRSGRLPSNNRVPWRANSHLTDRVVGGWYDAGDYLKHSLTAAQTTMFLAWGALDFQAGYQSAKQFGYIKGTVSWGAEYLAACHIALYNFVGLIGTPDIDHNYWGRAEDQTGKRPAYIWKKGNRASDLLGMTSAALASSSILLKPGNKTRAAQLLSKAEHLYNWAVHYPGLYSKTLPGYPTSLYPSSRYHDKLMMAAAWLHRATGNTTYLKMAYQHFKDAGGRNNIGPFVCWDDVGAAAVAMLLGTGKRIGASKVPGHKDYTAYFDNTFWPIYQKANGTWGVYKTPLGLRLADWSQWGNLRYSSNVAFVMLARAAALAPSSKRTSFIKYAKSQVDYTMTTTGRSFLVGLFRNPPKQAHHAGASCPNRPAPCNWNQYSSPLPNPQVLKGALVAGPRGPTDDTYTDLRSDYVSNEVAIDYNAGLCGALAGVLQLMNT